VTRLVRTEVGGVRLAGQRSGTLRELTREELAGLHHLIDTPAVPAKSRPKIGA
jgi:23S rRNA pseudouridine2605 synthase